MPSIRTMTAVFAAALLPAVTLASTLSLGDAGLSTSCGFSQCCIPTCIVYVGDFYGCNGSVDFSGTCQNNYDNPRNTQTVEGGGACDNVQVTFLRDPDGNPSVDVYYKPNAQYDRYSFFDCGAPTVGGNQCGVTGGGCRTSQTLTGAQG